MFRFFLLLATFLLACGGAIAPGTDRESDEATSDPREQSPPDPTRDDEPEPAPVGTPADRIPAACAGATKTLRENRWSSTYHLEDGHELARLLVGAWYRCDTSQAKTRSGVGVAYREGGTSVSLVVGADGELHADGAAAAWQPDLEAEPRTSTPGLTFLVDGVRQWAVLGLDRTSAVMGQSDQGSSESYYVRVELTPEASP